MSMRVAMRRVGAMGVGLCLTGAMHLPAARHARSRHPLRGYRQHKKEDEQVF
jgi:hypothetical protein